MAISPSNDRFGIVKETVAGTTPATPVILDLPFKAGTELTIEHDTVKSEVNKANRAADPSSKVNYRVGGGLQSELKRSTVYDTLFESGVSGTWSGSTLKGGNTDTSLTVVKRIAATSGDVYFYHRGAQVSSFSLSVATGTKANISYEFVGMTREHTATEIASSTYTPTASTLALSGSHIANVSVDGLTAICRSIELSVSHNREAHDGFESGGDAIGVGTGGLREVMLTMQFYRDPDSPLSPETLFSKNDTPLAVSFEIGSGANGYRITLPAATASEPTSETDNSKSLFTVVFNGSDDATAGTDIIIEKLA